MQILVMQLVRVSSKALQIDLLLLQQGLDESASAAVITGGLDCKLIHWDTTAGSAGKSMLGARHTGILGVTWLCISIV